MPAAGAAFGTGIPAVDRDQRAPVPGRFVFQLPHQFAPARVANRFGERVIANHVLDSKALDTDHLVVVNQSCREFVQAIKPLVSNLGMDSGHSAARLLAVLRSLLLPAECLLRPLVTVGTLGEMLGGGNV